MTALAKFREQVRIARECPGTYIVLTLDQAQAMVDEIEGPKPAGAHLRCERCGSERTIRFDYATASMPPDDADDDHAH